MSAHEAFLGVVVDHLYANCPNLTRSPSYQKPRCDCDWDVHKKVPHVGDRALGMVDPEGTDLCTRCVNRWRRTEAAHGS